jgi:hypothetical protein
MEKATTNEINAYVMLAVREILVARSADERKGWRKELKKALRTYDPPTINGIFERLLAACPDTDNYFGIVNIWFSLNLPS